MYTDTYKLMSKEMKELKNVFRKAIWEKMHVSPNERMSFWRESSEQLVKSRCEAFLGQLTAVDEVVCILGSFSPHCSSET